MTKIKVNHDLFVYIIEENGKTTYKIEVPDVYEEHGIETIGYLFERLTVFCSNVYEVQKAVNYIYNMMD